MTQLATNDCHRRCVNAVLSFVCVAAQAGKLTRLTDRTRPTRCARRHGPSGPIPPDQHSHPGTERYPRRIIKSIPHGCRAADANATPTGYGYLIRHSGQTWPPLGRPFGPCRASGPVNNQHRAGADPGAVFFLSRPVPPHYSTPPRPARGDGVHGLLSSPWPLARPRPLLL